MKTARLVLLALLTPALVFGADGAGTTGSPFLKVPISARAIALGGAIGATTGDAGVIDYNPAALADTERTDIQLAYIDYLDDTSLQSGTVAFPLSIGQPPRIEPLEGVEFTPNKLSVGVEYRQFRAEDTGRDSNGVKLDEFSARDQLIALGLAYPIMRTVSLGATGKLISNKLADKSISTYAFDVGTLARFSSRLSAGVSVQNMGSAKAFETESDPLPMLVRSSIAYRWSNLLFIGDLAGERDGVFRKSAGAEWTINRTFKLRAGGYHDTAFQFTGGLGVRIAGPQKAYRTPERASGRTKAAAAKEPVASDVAQQLLSKAVDKLTKQFIEAGTGLDQPTLAVLPLKSKEKVSPTVDQILARDFKRKIEFQTAAKSGSMDASDSEIVLLGEVTRAEDKYKINTRLVRMDDGKTIASNYAEIAVEEFAQRQVAVTTIADSDQAGFGRVDIGLDYGFSTSKDLGLTNTVTLRILY